MAKEKSIKLSPKHGVNPSLLHCPVCGRAYGIAVLGRLKDDAEAPKGIMVGNELCEDCKSVIKAGGVFFLEVRKGSDPKNPIRTGRLVGVKREWAEKVFNEVHNIAYMEDDMFENFFGEQISKAENK